MKIVLKCQGTLDKPVIAGIERDVEKLRLIGLIHIEQEWQNVLKKRISARFRVADSFECVPPQVHEAIREKYPFRSIDETFELEVECPPVEGKPSLVCEQVRGTPKSIAFFAPFPEKGTFSSMIAPPFYDIWFIDMPGGQQFGLKEGHWIVPGENDRQTVEEYYHRVEETGEVPAYWLKMDEEERKKQEEKEKEDAIWKKNKTQILKII